MAEVHVDLEEVGHVVRDGIVVELIYHEVTITSRVVRGSVLMTKSYTGRIFHLPVRRLLYCGDYPNLAMYHVRSLEAEFNLEI